MGIEAEKMQPTKAAGAKPRVQSSVQGVLQCFDSQADAVAQRNRQKTPNNNPGMLQIAQLQAMVNEHPARKSTQASGTPGVIQLGKKVAKLHVKIPRPGFVGSVSAMREDAKDMYPGESIHMAHRLSWQSIEATLRSGDDGKIDTMINNLTIPKRNFGDPASGGVAAGDTAVYDAVQAVIAKHGKATPQVAKALNSSPYNLRPGHGPTNSAIGGGPDAHFDETKPGEPMTPQSASLLPPGSEDSSDFMTMASFQDWEANFSAEYVVPAVKSIRSI